MPSSAPPNVQANTTMPISVECIVPSPRTTRDTGEPDPLRNNAIYIPTVCLGVTSSVAYTYGYGDGRIGPTRCALIDGARGDRWRRCQGGSTPPAGARSARSGLAAGLRRASTVDPGGFPRSRTTRQSASTPCDDA